MATVRRGPDDVLHVSDRSAAEIGELALRAGVALHELTPETASLEDVFFALTDGREREAAA